MIIAKCPLRISLAGGSTDLEDFLEENEYGAVVSFPCNLYTYITAHNDVFGFNSGSNKYIINYTIREEVSKICDIQNDIAREALQHFASPPVTCSFTGDIFSKGSGLASSSSYMISFIKAVSEIKQLNLSAHEVCKLTLQLERKFNPLTGHQDPYGCGIGGLKKMIFKKDTDPTIGFLPKEIFDCMDMFLVHTGVSRKSTDVLKTFKDPGSRRLLLDLVEEMESSIKSNDVQSFCRVINEGWKIKKSISGVITQNRFLQNIEESLLEEDRILAHRLCGAGNGGYFLVFMHKDKQNESFLKYMYSNVLPVQIVDTGVEAIPV